MSNCVFEAGSPSVFSCNLQVQVDVPDMKGRKEILAVHAKNKKLDAEVDLEAIAARTPGFSGADLANLLNEVRLPNPYVDGLQDIQDMPHSGFVPRYQSCSILAGRNDLAIAQQRLIRRHS